MAPVVIANFGLHWRKDLIQWGSRGPGSGGELLGTATRKGQRHVDFRWQRGIYALYSDFELIYIGLTRDQGLFDRLRQHRDDHLSERWSRFSWFGTRAVTRANQLAPIGNLSSFESKAVIATLEAVCIAVAEPRLNLKRGAWPRPFKQFYQFEGPKDETEQPGSTNARPRRGEWHTDGWKMWCDGRTQVEIAREFGVSTGAVISMNRKMRNSGHRDEERGRKTRPPRGSSA